MATVHLLKGIVARDGYFFEDPKNRPVLFVRALMVFAIFLAALHTENPFRNPLQDACSGFPKATCDSKKLF
jgi:hypothetical protein